MSLLPLIILLFPWRKTHEKYKGEEGEGVRMKIYFLKAGYSDENSVEPGTSM